MQLDPVTGEILVPGDVYHQARISLAAQGLPICGGFDTLDNMPLGISRSVEGVKLRQAQEVELSKSITEISSIKSAKFTWLHQKSLFLYVIKYLQLHQFCEFEKW